MSRLSLESFVFCFCIVPVLPKMLFAYDGNPQRFGDASLNRYLNIIKDCRQGALVLAILQWISKLWYEFKPATYVSRANNKKWINSREMSSQTSEKQTNTGTQCKRADGLQSRQKFVAQTAKGSLNNNDSNSRHFLFNIRIPQEFRFIQFIQFQFQKDTKHSM